MECDLCGHSLENNEHGIDQNDLYMENGDYIHGGTCSYCNVCNPIDPEKLARFKAEYAAKNDIKDGETICRHGERPFECDACRTSDANYNEI